MKTEVDLECPKVPDRIKVKGTNHCIPVSKLSVPAIRQLGKEWTRKLLEKSKKKSSKVSE